MYTEFALSAAWKKHNFGHLEACPNVPLMHAFLQGVLSSPFSFMMKFGKSVVHVFLNDIAQKNLLFALIDEHRVHLPAHHQQTHLHSVFQLVQIPCGWANTAPSPSSYI